MTKCLLGAIMLMATTSLSAQTAEPMVSAQDPEGLAKVLMDAGYEAELTTDRQGDPMIRTELANMTTRLVFYGCDEQTNSDCDSVQFTTGFDRKEPWTKGEAIQISEKLRFAAVSLDDEGDPYISWDVFTGDGIPSRVFLQSVLKYSSTVESTADIVFADE